ncbi:MAG: hypothetical protein HY017_27205 [Betaproteobacteria bacterium]|nr:hypothetical protein [Betaproteobacteria bacterium]
MKTGQPARRRARDSNGKSAAAWFLAVVLCGLLVGCSEKAPPPVVTSAGQDAIEVFLERHWTRPIAAQGAVPAGFSAQEAALDPDACGRCHVQQFSDWKTSLHAKAMGPGVLGQLIDMAPDASEEHQACIRCHAPLAEQATSLSVAIARPRAAGAQVSLHEHGLTCAACHVRQHERFGPPRRDGITLEAGNKALPHGGWKSNAAFEDSRFCAACHQFSEGDFALNGKLLENTYEEWKASRYAREGKSCQSCHMPERRHLWRGVHDEQMVKNGVTVTVAGPFRATGMLEAVLTIRNTGTGHRFPTYVTPKVIAEIYQTGMDGRVVPGTLRQHVIARLVELDLSREIADTRLAPDEETVLKYREQMDPRAAFLVYRIRVEPDAFYTELFNSLIAGGQAVRGRTMILDALANSRRAPFTFFEVRQPLRGPGPAQ